MVKSSFPGAASPPPATAQPLSDKNVRALRARAHALKPVVWIAATGPTEGVVRELDRALAAHELVKIHAAIDDRAERGRLLQSLCRELGAQPVQTIGKMLVAFRARPAPVANPQARAGARRLNRGAKRTPAHTDGKPARPPRQSATTGARGARHRPR